MPIKAIAIALLILAIAFPLRECANTGREDGVTPHTYWLKWDDAEMYEDSGYMVTAVPMYAKCCVCGYSFYLDHVTTSRVPCGR